MDGSHNLSDAVERLARSHPHAPAQDVLEVVFRGSRGLYLPWELVHPATPLGQAIASAFDPAMTPAEWRAWTSEQADPALSRALLEFWRDEVLKSFGLRYGLEFRLPGCVRPPGSVNTSQLAATPRTADVSPLSTSLLTSTSERLLDD